MFDLRIVPRPALESEGRQRGRVRMIQGDLTKPKEVLDAVNGCSIVFHVASPDPNSPNRGLLEAVNVTGTRNVVAACRAAGVRSLVYTSSASVVFEGADQKGPTEAIGYPARYRDIYSETKARAERIVRRAGCLPVVLEGEGEGEGGSRKNVPQMAAAEGVEEERLALERALGYGADLVALEAEDGDGDWRLENNGGLATVSVRPHGIFGSRDRVLVPSLAAQGAAGRTKFRVGDGNNVVDFTYVGNVAHAHMLAAEKAVPPAETQAGRAAVQAALTAGKSGDSAVKAHKELSRGDVRVGASGQTYFVTNDDPIPFWEFLGRLLDGLGWPVPSLWLPYGFILPLATVAESVSKGIAALKGARPKPMTFSPARMQIVGTWHYYDCGAAKRELGYAPVWSMDEGVFLTLKAFAGQRNPKARSSKVQLEGEVTSGGDVVGDWQPAFTKEEVALHCTEDDLWVTIEDKVYDVTRYQPKHPGGGDKLLRHAGQDATEKFVKVRSHPEGVRDIAAQFMIGTLAKGAHRATSGASGEAAGASGAGGFAALAGEGEEEEEQEE